MKQLFSALVFFLILLVIPIAGATDYYVAKTGNDAWEGNITHPWLTVQKAADTLAAGDTVYIKEGTYNEKITPQNNGSVGNYITYSAYLSHIVVLNGTGLPTYPNGMFRVENKNYIIISGLEIKNYNNTGACHGIDILGSGHITIANNSFNTIGGCGIHVTTSSNITIDNNDVGYTNLDPAWGQEMISLAGVDTAIIKNNYVHHSDNIAIDIKSGSSNGKIFRNYVHNTGSGIYTDGYSAYQHNMEVYQNLVHNVTYNAYLAAAEEPEGILENIRFFNNIGYNCYRGFVIYNAPGSVNNLTVINNIFHECETYCMMDTDVNTTNITFRNNIISECSGIKTDDLPEVTVDHNLFSGWSPVYGSNSINATPNFFNVSSGDFRVNKTSYALDNGSSTNAPNDDYNGSYRLQGSAVDIGAFEISVGLYANRMTRAYTDGAIYYEDLVASDPLINWQITPLNHLVIVNAISNATITITSTEATNQIWLNTTVLSLANKEAQLLRNGTPIATVDANATGFLSHLYTEGFSTYEFKYQAGSPPAGNVSGFIYSTVSNPIQDAVCYLSYLNGSYLAMVNTSADGSYNFTNVDSGDYYIFAKEMDVSSGGSANFTVAANITTWCNLTLYHEENNIAVGKDIFVDLSNSFDFEDSALTYSCNRTDLFTDFSISTGKGNWTSVAEGTYPIKFGASDGVGYSNKTVIFDVSLNRIITGANEWILFNNWSSASQTFLQIATKESNDLAYSYYNSTSGSQESYWVGYSINQDNSIPKNESLMGYFDSITTITCDVPSAENITIPAEVWFYTYLRGSVSKNLTQIKEDIE